MLWIPIQEVIQRGRYVLSGSGVGKNKFLGEYARWHCLVDRLEPLLWVRPVKVLLDPTVLARLLEVLVLRGCWTRVDWSRDNDRSVVDLADFGLWQALVDWDNLCRYGSNLIIHDLY